MFLLLACLIAFVTSERPCVDIREECSMWSTTLFNAQNGLYETSQNGKTECDRDRDYMMQYCPESCGFCAFKVLSKAQDSASCKTYGCDSPYNPSHSCQCNTECKNHGDCCSDYDKTCGGSGGKGSCKKYGCNTSYNPSHDCQCNSSCESHDDCCSDYQTACGGGGKTVGCPKAPSHAEDRRINKQSLKIVDWNVDWLFTNVSHDMGKIVCPGACDWKNQSIALEHLKTVTQNLEAIGADMIFLEETEDCDTLSAIIDGMSQGSKWYKPYNHLGQDTYTGQNPGCITKIDPIEDISFSTETIKYPVPGSTCPKDYSGTHGNSKHFKARFNLEKFNLTVVVTHLLAIPDDDQRCPEREAQATVLAHIIEKAKAAGDEIMVTGDFNDYDDSVADANGNKPISSALRIIREAGGLTNLASRFDVKDRYSDWYDRNRNCIDDGGNEHSMIDHILLSPNLLNHVKDGGILHNFVNHCDCLYSDHWPVWVEFDFTDYKPLLEPSARILN